MTDIKQVGGGPTQPSPVDNERPLTPAQMDTIKQLIAESKDFKNTNTQTDVVQKIWDNLRPAVVARYIALPPDAPPVVARYIAPMPDPDIGLEYIVIAPPPGDDVVAEYVAPAPSEPLPGTAFDPERYDGAAGPALANLADTRDVGATDDDGNFLFPDDGMVMYYLVAPPPPDPEHKPRFEALRTMDQDMNKTFSALLETAEKVIKDGKIDDGELAEFSRLHYAFDLCAKLFYDNLKEYQKDFPFAANPEERNPADFRRFSGEPASTTPPAADVARPQSDSPSSILGVQSSQLKKDD